MDSLDVSVETSTSGTSVPVLRLAANDTSPSSSESAAINMMVRTAHTVDVGDSVTSMSAKFLASEESTPKQVGRFEIRRRLGSGGMGVVFEAFDPQLERSVALKLIRDDNKAGQASLLREARAAARINHPNVVTVYEVGTIGDRVFIVMELVVGRALDRWMADCERSLDETLDVFIQAGRGLECAHHAGLVHRDFKPANVIVGDDGRVRVADFGLVRFLNTAAPGDGGGFRGTPGFMSPEQFLGEKTDGRADQFAFCVALFEALHGMAPFEGETVFDLMSNVLEGHIVTSKVPVPSRLDLVVKRGLHARPAERYPNMTNLLAELVSFREYEAMRVGQAIALVDGARAAHARGHHVEARAKLRSSIEEQDSVLGRALFWTLRRDPLMWRIRKVDGMSCAFLPDGQGAAVTMFGGTMHLIDTRSAQRRVIRLRLDDPETVSAHEGGRFIAAADVTGRIALWDGERGEAKWLDGHRGYCLAVRFIPGKTSLVSGGQDGRVLVWANDKVVFEIVREGPAIQGLDVSPCGRELAWHDASGAVYIAKIRPEAKPTKLADVSTTNATVVYSKDGRWLAVPGPDLVSISLFSRDAEGTTLHTVLEGHAQRARSYVFSRDGERLISGDYGGEIIVWDPTLGTVLKRLRDPEQSQIRAIDVHGELVLTCGDSVGLWDLAVAQAPTDLGGPASEVFTVATSGASIIAGSADGSLCRLDRDGRRLDVLDGHRSAMSTVTPLGTAQAISGGYDGTLRLWDLDKGAQRRVFYGHDAGISSVVGLPGHRMASGSWDGTVRVWDLQGAELRRWSWSSVVTFVSASPDGAWLAMGGPEIGVQVAQLEGEEIIELDVGKAIIWGAQWSPDASVLMWADDRGWLSLWNRGTGKVQRYPGPRAQRATRLALNPDGTHVAVPFVDGSIGVFDLKTKAWTELAGHGGAGVNTVCFSDDGSRLISAGEDATVRVWSFGDWLPVWRGPLLMPGGGAFTHRGWTGPDNPRLGRDVRLVIETRARRVVCTESLLFLLDHRGRLEVWSLPQDRCIHALSVRQPVDMMPWGEACLVLEADTLHCLDEGGERWRLEAIDAFCALPNEALICRDGEVASVTLDDASAARVASCPPGVTALTRSHGDLLLGFEDGGLEALRLNWAREGTNHAFEDTPSAAVVRLLEGPSNTAIAAFVDGSLGIWSQSDGKKLFGTSVHGALYHLGLHGETLVGLSELGQELRLDLREFASGYDELRQAVVADINLVWDRGLPRVSRTDTKRPS